MSTLTLWRSVSPSNQHSSGQGEIPSAYDFSLEGKERVESDSVSQAFGTLPEGSVSVLPHPRSWRDWHGLDAGAAEDEGKGSLLQLAQLCEPGRLHKTRGCSTKRKGKKWNILQHRGIFVKQTEIRECKWSWSLEKKKYFQLVIIYVHKARQIHGGGLVGEDHSVSKPVFMMRTGRGT